MNVLNVIFCLLLTVISKFNCQNVATNNFNETLIIATTTVATTTITSHTMNDTNIDSIYKWAIFAEKISLFVNPVLFSVGAVLNIITIIVFCKPELKRLSVTIYTIALAVSDLCVLIFPIALTWLSIYKPTFPLFRTMIWCHLHGYIDMMFCFSSSWNIVAISHERWQAVCRPLVKQNHSKSNRALITVISIAVISIVINVWYPFCVQYDKYICKQRNTQIFKIMGAITILIIYVIPFILISILNGMIVIAMRQRISKRKYLLDGAGKNIEKKNSVLIDKTNPQNDNHLMIELQETSPEASLLTNKSQSTISSQRNTNRTKRYDSDASINLMLVTVCVTFLILTFPYQFSWIYWEIRELYLDNQKGITETDIDEHGLKKGLYGEITLTIRNINYAINFFLYSTISTQFRRELTALFSCFKFTRNK